jgi:hypothetical protein
MFIYMMMSKYFCVTWFLTVGPKLAYLACLQDLRVDCADLRSKFQPVNFSCAFDKVQGALNASNAPLQPEARLPTLQG